MPTQSPMNAGDVIGDLVVPSEGFRPLDASGMRELLTHSVPMGNALDRVRSKGAACARHVPEHRRVFLMQLVFPFQGSTALAGMMMSSAEMATLCAFKDWNCEGRKILEANNVELEAPADFERMLDLYAQTWDLSKQVLFDKSPGLLLNVPSVHTGLSKAPIPARMSRHGVTNMIYAYVLMWRPLCLSRLSNHAMRTVNEEGMQSLARLELKRLEHHVGVHRWLSDRTLPVLVINFGDLMWRSTRSAQRLEAFAPCLGPITATYVPQLGVDIFKGNGWKADGSVKAFGESIDPAALNYSVSNGHCTGAFSYGVLLDNEELQRAREASDYLLSYS